MNAPTHHQEGRSSTCVDYVALNRKGHAAVLTAKVKDEIYTTSDHDLLEITMNAPLLLLPEHPRQRQRRIPVRKLKNEKRLELYNKLLGDQWETLKEVEFNDPERCYNAYKACIIQAAEAACNTREYYGQQMPERI